MQQSKLFSKTQKNPPRDAETPSHKFLVRGGFVDNLMSGVYSFLPLGFLVYKKIEQIIREEMNAIGAQELLLPVLQPKELWKKSGRWDNMEPPLFKLKDIHGKNLALGPTHEEVISVLARKFIHSYKDLPLAVYQIQDKFRNELRSTGGLLRVREFIMKDLYSFHINKTDLDKYYLKVKKAYFKIYQRCGLDALSVEAETGSIGGSLSHEFVIPCQSGEDQVFICDSCKKTFNAEFYKKQKNCPSCKKKLRGQSCIETGHIFKLGRDYSSKLNVRFTTKNGKKKSPEMGCYGIGLGRLMATIVEVYHDKKGIIWPKNCAPYLIHLLPLGDKKVAREAERVYNDLIRQKQEVLFDDREESAGVKFADSDLIGIPLRIVISENTLRKASAEFRFRGEKKTKIIPLKSLLGETKKILKNKTKKLC